MLVNYLEVASVFSKMLYLLLKHAKLVSEIQILVAMLWLVT